LTYVETAYAILHNEPCAAVENASGHWVQPSEFNDAVALERAQLLPDLEQKLGDVYRSPLASAYPISAYSYLMTPESQIAAQKGAVLGRFIQYLACAGQQAAGQLGYSPLPPNLVEEDFKGISRINGTAAPPPAPTAANCKNPYVDGQTPLPGEPVIAGTPGTTDGNTNSSAGNKTSSAGSAKGTTGGGARDTSNGRSGSATHVGPRPSKSPAPSAKGVSVAPSSGTAGQHDTVLATGLWPGESVLGGSRDAANLPDGQIGSALETAGIGLSGHGGPTFTMVGGAIALVALLGLPPLAASVRRRRRHAASVMAGADR
jgi:hypothetical protein